MKTIFALVALLAFTAPLAQAQDKNVTCVDLSQGIPFDVEDIISRVLTDVDDSGLLGMIPLLTSQMNLDPLKLPMNFSFNLDVASLNISKITISDVAIGGWSNIASLGKIDTDETIPTQLSMEPFLKVNGPIWLNASTDIEGELLPLQLLDLAVGLGINLDSLSLGMDLDICMDSDVFSFSGLVNIVIQMLSMDKDKQIPFLMKSLFQGIHSVQFNTLDLQIVVKEFFLANHKNQKTMDINLPQNVQDMVDNAVEYLVNSSLKDDVNKILDKIFNPTSEGFQGLDSFLNGDAFEAPHISINYVMQALGPVMQIVKALD